MLPGNNRLMLCRCAMHEAVTFWLNRRVFRESTCIVADVSEVEDEDGNRAFAVVLQPANWCGRGERRQSVVSRIRHRIGRWLAGAARGVKCASR